MNAPVLAERQPLSRRAKVLITLGGLLLLGSMLVTGVFSFLLAPPKKVLVVELVQPSTEQQRQQLKDDCGDLPGVGVVKDQGNPSPQIQGRFPVRFDIGDADIQQEAALERCINQHAYVRGFLSEGDR